METIRSLLDLLDIANYLPELSAFAGGTKLILWLLMLVGPVIMVGLGILSFTKPASEANYSWGFRSYFVMGSVEAWRYAQRLAGLCWLALGGGMTVIALGLGFLALVFNAGQTAVMALWGVGAELLLVVASWIFVNAMVIKNFDKDGNPRNAVEDFPEEEYPEIEE